MSKAEYRVHELLGRGGFGRVYHATFLGEGGFSKEVALKVSTEQEEQTELNRIIEEARILGMLRHPAIVAADRLLRIDGHWVLAMEYVDGACLAQVRQCGPVPVRIVCAIIADVASALQSAYRSTTPDGRPLRLVHRDIKPSNILLTRDGHTKVLDFGIAHADLARPVADTTAGTPPYVAPERLNGLDHVRGDIFSLGVVMAELLTGQTWGPTPATEPLVAARSWSIVTALREQGVSELVIAVVSAMLTFQADQRPDAGAVAERCRALEGELQGPALSAWANTRIGAAMALRETLGEDDWTGTLKSAHRTDPDSIAADDEDSGETTASLQVVAAARRPNQARGNVFALAREPTPVLLYQTVQRPVEEQDGPLLTLVLAAGIASGIAAGLWVLVQMTV